MKRLAIVAVLVLLTSCGGNRLSGPEEDVFEDDAGATSIGEAGSEVVFAGRAGASQASTAGRGGTASNQGGARAGVGGSEVRTSNAAGESGASVPVAGFGGSEVAPEEDASEPPEDAQSSPDAGTDTGPVDSAADIPDATVDAQAPTDSSISDSAVTDATPPADTGTDTGVEDSGPPPIPPECYLSCDVANDVPGLELTVQEKQTFISADGYLCPLSDGGLAWLYPQKCPSNEWCNGGVCAPCTARDNSKFTKLIFEKGTANEQVVIDVSGCHGTWLYGRTDTARCPQYILPIHAEFAPHRFPAFDSGIEWGVKFSIFGDGMAQVQGVDGATVSSYTLDNVLNKPGEYGARVTFSGKTPDGTRYWLQSYFYERCQ